MRRVFLKLALLAVVVGCGRQTPTAPDAMLVDPNTLMPTSAGSTGRWVGRNHSVTGSVTLLVENGVARLSFSNDFTVADAPGPFVYVNTTDNPNTGRPLRVASVKNRQGAQSYTFQVPPGVRYTYVLIWCDPYNVAIADAAIPPTP